MGFSPITSNDIKEVMEEMNIKNLEAGKEEVMKDFFRSEMSMPEEVIKQLKFTRIFQKVGGSEDDKMSRCLWNSARTTCRASSTST